MSKRQKILIVDDEPLNVDYLEQELEDLDYETVSATDGDEALAQVTAKKPDLILLDIIMPGLDGFQVCKTLKDDPETRLIPIIIMTALGDTRDRIKGIEAGADDFLTKPVNSDELFARIRTSLRLKQTIERKIDRLVEVNQLLANAIEAGHVLQIILESANHLFAAQGSNIVFTEAGKQELSGTRCAPGHPLEPFHLKLGQGILGWVAQTGRSVLSNDTLQDLRFQRDIDRAIGTHTYSVLAAPLLQEGHTIGAIEVINTSRPHGFSSEELQLLTALGDLATVAIDRAKRLVLDRDTIEPPQTEISEPEKRAEISQRIGFEAYQIDPMNRCIWRGKKRVPLDPKAFSVLSHLIENADRLVKKEELLDVVWPGEVVSEAVIKFQIQRIRATLKDDPRTPRFIETVHRLGYRFVGRLKPVKPDPLDAQETHKEFSAAVTMGHSLSS